MTGTRHVPFWFCSSSCIHLKILTKYLVTSLENNFTLSVENQEIRVQNLFQVSKHLMSVYFILDTGVKFWKCQKSNSLPECKELTVLSGIIQ